MRSALDLAVTESSQTGQLRSIHSAREMIAHMERPRIHLSIYDKPSVVWAYRLCPAQRLDPDDACNGPLEAPYWLHFSLTDEPSRRWLASDARLPQAALSVLLEVRPRPSMVRLEGGLLGVVVDMHHDFHGDPEAFGELRFFVDADRIVSVRRHPLRTIDVMRRKLDAGHDFPAPLAFLEHLTENLAESFGGVVANLVQQVDLIEDEIVAGRGLEQRGELADIRRLLTRFRRHLHGNRSALHSVVVREPRDAHAPLGLSPHALARLDGVSQDLDLVHERVRLLQEEVTGLLAEANNQNLYVLSVVTAVLLPATLIASLWGANVGGVPWADNPRGFVWVSLLVLFSILLSLLALRKLRGL